MLAGITGAEAWLVVNPKVALPPGGSVVFQSAFFIVASDPATDRFPLQELAMVSSLAST